MINIIKKAERAYIAREKAKKEMNALKKKAEAEQNAFEKEFLESLGPLLPLVGAAQKGSGGLEQS